MHDTPSASTERSTHHDHPPAYELGDLVTVAQEGHTWRRTVYARAETVYGIFKYQLFGESEHWFYEDELRPWADSDVSAVAS